MLVGAILTGVIVFLTVNHVSEDATVLIVIGGFLFFTLVIRYLESKRVQKKLAVSEEKHRFLLFGGIIPTYNGEKNTMFVLFKTSRSAAVNLLKQYWGIASEREAKETVKRLAATDTHTPFADDVYHNLIMKDILTPGPEDLATLEASTAQQVDRIKKGLAAYKKAQQVLAKAGITNEDIAGITTLSAWDYGRVAFIARYSTHCGYMTEDECWPIMQEVAKAAAQTYTNWRQYLAAYVIGRAIAYGDTYSIGLQRFIDKNNLDAVPFKDKEITT